MIVFLYRPSPQVPQPSAKSARHCFEASTSLIYMQKRQIDTSSVDLTWIFTQTLFMSLNAILWSLSYPEIRQEYPKERVEKDINVAKEAIFLASRRWPGVESALELYQNLIVACLKAYDENSEVSYVVDSSSSKGSPATLQDTSTSPSMPAAFDFGSPLRQGNQLPRSSLTWSLLRDAQLQPKNTMPYISPPSSSYSLSDSGLANDGQPITTTMPSSSGYRVFHDPVFDQNSLFNAFPQNFDYLQALPSPSYTSRSNLGFMGEQYSQYLHEPYFPQYSHYTHPALTQEQWPELMKDLQNKPADWGREDRLEAL